MRHDSKRVPGKNYRLFGGKPLYHHVVEALLACPNVHRVVIDTDSPSILDDAPRAFPSVEILRRPEHLRADTIPMNDVLLNATACIDSDLYLQTHSTNPLLQTSTIHRAVQQFMHNSPAVDSLFSVTKLQTRLWDQLIRPVNHNPAILLRTQDLPPVFEENSCIYLFSRNTLRERHNRIGARPTMFEIDKIEAMDIDEEADFRIAEQLYLDRANNRVKAA